MANLYDPQIIKNLFDEMAGTYGWVNLLSSFGFCWRWRKQCLRAVEIPPGGRGLDLMTGMAELCSDLCRRLGCDGSVNALDISESMCRLAARQTSNLPVEVIQADVLAFPFEPASIDVIVSSFGLKTLSPGQIATLARIVFRTLKPGGVFSFVEISVPTWTGLRWPYMFYVNRIIPIVGFLMLGNPDNYRQLGVYTSAFQNCRETCRVFSQAGLEVRYHSYFFGCATGISGKRPIEL